MNQLPLLEREIAIAEEAKPLTHRDDPITSTIAAREMVESGTLTAQQRTVLAALKLYPDLTSDELAERARLDRFMVARRLPDLMRLGLAQQGERRRSSVGKRQCVTWRATEESNA